jgi:hypothetical protein
MTDRDTFAAAALTGLLYHNHEQRELTKEKQDSVSYTTHDAAPAAPCWSVLHERPLRP